MTSHFYRNRQTSQAQSCIIHKYLRFINISAFERKLYFFLFDDSYYEKCGWKVSKMNSRKKDSTLPFTTKRSLKQFLDWFDINVMSFNRLLLFQLHIGHWNNFLVYALPDLQKKWIILKTQQLFNLSSRSLFNRRFVSGPLFCWA